MKVLELSLIHISELYSKEPGDKVELVINRNGQERKVSVVLGEQ